MIELGITHVVNCGKYVKNHICDDYFESGSQFLTDAAHQDTYGVTVPDQLPDPPIQYFECVTLLNALLFAAYLCTPLSRACALVQCCG